MPRAEPDALDMIGAEDGGPVERWALTVAVACSIVGVALVLLDGPALPVATVGLVGGAVALIAQHLRFRREDRGR